jgi:drug/metabolite transporter (DMT)-like permease
MTNDHLPPAEVPAAAVARARLLILLAALLWSLGSLFVKLLTRPTFLELHEPALSPLQIAFYRLLFAGLVLAPLVRRADLSFRMPMVWMVLSFAAMNGLYVSAQALGRAATAILLQYTAPLYIYLVGIWLLGKKAELRATVTLALGMAGLAVIILGDLQDTAADVLLLGVGGGITYAFVLLLLGSLRAESPIWLTVWNHLGAALLLAPLGLAVGLPTWPQLAVLVVYGVVQMGLPYYLLARGLRAVNPQEAATITLIEPLLNPIWAYIVSPETESLPWTTFLGGALIVGGLAWRYWPRRVEVPR